MVYTEGMATMIKHLLSNIAYWMLVAFAVFLIYEIIRKISGGSLGFEELVIGVLVMNLSLSFYLRESINKVDNKITGHIGWHKGRNN